MKKAVVLFFTLIFLFVFGSCSLNLQKGENMFGKMFSKVFGGIYDSDQEIANKRFDKALKAIRNKDKESLKSMFSKESIAVCSEGFNESIDRLFDYFQGDVKPYDDQCPLYVDTSREKDQVIKNIYSTYDVMTDKQTYRIAIQDCVIDETNSANVGIWSLYIIKMEDDTDPSFAYWGDGKNTPGININIKNNLSD